MNAQTIGYALLGTTALAAVVCGTVIVVMGHTIPEGFYTLGTAALTGLAGLLVPTKKE